MAEKFEIPGYSIEDRRFALPILQDSFSEALQDLSEALGSFHISSAEVIGGGGGEAPHTQRLRKELAERGWPKTNIRTEQTIKIMDSTKGGSRSVEERPLPSESHEVDHVRTFDLGTLALEIEWNNKDPFYDRDLENFRRLHQIGLVKVGIIITRGPGLQQHLYEIFKEHYSGVKHVDDIVCTAQQKKSILQKVAGGGSLPEAASTVLFSNKYGAATTHWDKLIDRVDNRLLGNPSPLLLIGIGPDRVGSMT